MNYTGISFPFRFSPSGGVAKSSTSATDSTHIKESISQIVRTQITERVMETNFGTNTLSFLYEPMDGDATILGVAQYSITKALNTWEKRIKLQSVSVVPDTANATLNITVFYAVLATNKPDSVNVSMPLGTT